MYDLIIIGAGPAGFSASIYATRREMKTLIISRNIGGQIIWANDIENYPGFRSISNFELINKLKEHALSFGASLEEKEVINVVKNNDNTFSVFTKETEFKTKTVILALGLIPRQLNIIGENDFNGKGISYCANCDGPFYRDKIVVVVGGGNSAFDAAEVMSKIASKVYILNRSEKYRAFDAIVNKVKDIENITIVNNAEIKEIIGGTKVEKIKYLDSKSQKEKEIKTDGIFIEIGRKTNTKVVEHLVDTDDFGQIIVDKNNMTTTPGLFAAGDVVSGTFKQIPVASGQGTQAALSAYQYIQENNI
jgi:thioredoxin-disulfide reductase